MKIKIEKFVWRFYGLPQRSLKEGTHKLKCKVFIVLLIVLIVLLWVFLLMSVASKTNQNKNGSVSHLMIFLPQQLSTNQFYLFVFLSDFLTWVWRLTEKNKKKHLIILYKLLLFCRTYQWMHDICCCWDNMLDCILYSSLCSTGQ